MPLMLINQPLLATADHRCYRYVCKLLEWPLARPTSQNTVQTGASHTSCPRVHQTHMLLLLPTCSNDNITWQMASCQKHCSQSDLTRGRARPRKTHDKVSTPSAQVIVIVTTLTARQGKERGETGKINLENTNKKKSFFNCGWDDFGAAWWGTHERPGKANKQPQGGHKVWDPLLLAHNV